MTTRCYSCAKSHFLLSPQLFDVCNSFVNKQSLAYLCLKHCWPKRNVLSALLDLQPRVFMMLAASLPHVTCFLLDKKTLFVVYIQT